MPGASVAIGKKEDAYGRTRNKSQYKFLLYGVSVFPPSQQQEKSTGETDAIVGSHVFTDAVYRACPAIG
jgi:hypothetical protein